jgi:hypothetical protein
MGALRKSIQAAPQPTQIIIFPVGQVRPDLAERPSFWERFSDSEAGSVILFELQMFGVVAAVAGLFWAAALGLGSIQQSTGFEMSETTSTSRLVHQLQESSWAPAHTLRP